MAIKNTTDVYGAVAQFIHWLMAIMIIVLLILELSIEAFQTPILYKIHKTIGFSILPLVIIRLLWSLYNKTPGYSGSMPKGTVLYIHSFHYILYVIM